MRRALPAQAVHRPMMACKAAAHPVSRALGLAVAAQHTACNQKEHARMLIGIQMAGKGYLLPQSTLSGDTAEASSHKAACGPSWVTASASYCLSDSVRCGFSNRSRGGLQFLTICLPVVVYWVGSIGPHLAHSPP